MNVNKFFDKVIWWLDNTRPWLDHWALWINFISWEFYLKILNGLFLCCHEQVKKILEMPSRSTMWPPNIPIGREIILCINVSRYLPKEKEETNFLYEESISSANTRERERQTKWGNKSKAYWSTCWTCKAREKEEIRFPHKGLENKRKLLLSKANPSPINRTLIPLILFIPHKLEIESFSL